jgi:hypothetical protein
MNNKPIAGNSKKLFSDNFLIFQITEKLLIAMLMLEISTKEWNKR